VSTQDMGYVMGEGRFGTGFERKELGLTVYNRVSALQPGIPRTIGGRWISWVTEQSQGFG